MKNKMKKLAVALVGGIVAGTSAGAWEPGEPVTTYWFGPGCPGTNSISLAMTDAWAKQLKEGGFNTKSCVLFNVIQVVANAVAWIVVAPVLDILVYSEPANKVFAQGAVAFVCNIVIIGILGSILLTVYSKVAGKSSDLKAED